MTQETKVDLLVIGGGINGTGIARDAAGRGLSVLLCEQGDLACATSSASSKLIHGGLRYLEHLAFNFVRQALVEQDILLSVAPHIIAPMRFILPHDPALRPAWMIALGLAFYDWLNPRRRLPRSRRIDLCRGEEGASLKENFRLGFAYYDAFTDDSRLVILNAIGARDLGAAICTRARFVTARRDDRRLWTAKIEDQQSGATRSVTARAIVNAAGPWAGAVQAAAGARDDGQKLRLVKGSHIILPRLYQGNHAYLLQNDDGRIVFVIPFAQNFSLIGTTEVPFDGDPSKAAISPDEEAYLCLAVSRYFREPLDPAQIIHRFSGVRPLVEDKAASASAVTREFVLDLDAPPNGAPLLRARGGKITTYRQLAEQAVDRLVPLLRPPRPRAWTARVPLPGGNIKNNDLEPLKREVRASHPWLEAQIIERLVHSYGTRVWLILREIPDKNGLGADFGAGLFQAEIDYLIAEEWAKTGEDVLWRRTKLGLHLSPARRARVETHMAARCARGVPRA
jgi:glycerol-3-phosphate dehydrogenase